MEKVIKQCELCEIKFSCDPKTWIVSICESCMVPKNFLEENKSTSMSFRIHTTCICGHRFPIPDDMNEICEKCGHNNKEDADPGL